MNNSRSSGLESHKSLQILNELSGNDSLTQRDLSSRLDIALGLVNSYIRNLIAKGFITVKSIPPRRYAYFLTPKGFTEKTRLTYDLLHDYTRIYREARSGLKELFTELRSDGVRRVAFAGADEIAEIAYITLHETDIELTGVVDDVKNGAKFFKTIVMPIQDIHKMKYDRVVLSTFLRREEVYRSLLKNRVPEEKILAIYDVPSVKA